MLEKLEEKYGVIMNRKDVMELLKVSLSTVKRMEQDGKLIRVPNQGRVAKFYTQDIARFLGVDND